MKINLKELTIEKAHESLKEGVYNFRLERRGYPHYNGEVEIKQGDKKYD